MHLCRSPYPAAASNCGLRSERFMQDHSDKSAGTDDVRIVRLAVNMTARVRTSIGSGF